MFGNGWLTHVISMWILESLAKCTSMHTHVTKIDPHFKTSPGHPCLDNPPQVGLSEAKYAKQRNTASKPQKSGPPKKQPCLDVEVLNDIVIKNRTDDELVLFSKKQSMEGKRDIQRWLLMYTNRKQRQDFLDTAWLIEDTEMNASRARKSCMDVLREALSSECNVHPKTHALCAKR